MSSNILAITAAILGIFAAIFAGLSALKANKEADAAVQTARSAADVKIANASLRADVKIKVAQASAETQIAKANEQAARANERAAVLESEAATARLKIVQLAEGVGARVVTATQKQEIVDALRGTTTDYFVVTGPGQDVESIIYAGQITDALIAAGMKPWNGQYPLGSGLVDHSQKMTVAARATAAKKAVGQRS